MLKSLLKTKKLNFIFVKMIGELVIIGKAGTGKTHRLAQIIHSAIENKQSFIVCGPTHNSIENLRKRCNFKNNEYDKNFRTIYSFFRINYITGEFAGLTEKDKKDKDILIIDEISMIEKKLFKQIYRIANKYFSSIILCGDPLQLNPIYREKQYISFKKLSRYLEHCTNAKVIEHYANSIFSTSIVKNMKHEVLTKNYRSNDECMKIIENVLYSDGSLAKFIFYDDLIKKLGKKECTLIASNYEVLQKFYTESIHDPEEYTIVKQKCGSAGFKQLYLKEGESYRILETNDNFYNGEIVELKNIFEGYIRLGKSNGECITVGMNNDVYNIGPINYITIHKSQGLSVDHVVLCVDNLFNIAMLYTGMTRCVKSLLFYSKENDKLAVLNNAKPPVEYYNNALL